LSESWINDLVAAYPDGAGSGGGAGSGVVSEGVVTVDVVDGQGLLAAPADATRSGVAVPSEGTCPETAIGPLVDGGVSCGPSSGYWATGTFGGTTGVIPCVCCAGGVKAGRSGTCGTVGVAA
jgi:hypothetical protein